MRHRIWLLILVVISMSLACAKEEKPSDTSPAAAATATPQPSYKLTVTFEGLIGFVNTRAGNVVWAMLPKADADDPRPRGTAKSLTHYPSHYTVLKVNGKNVKGIDQPIALQIAIDGYDITTSLSTGTGSSLTAAKFVQTANSPVDQIAASMLAATLTPADQKLLAARMKLPNQDLEAHDGTDQFFETTPQPPSVGICRESIAITGTLAKRVELVTWSPTLTGDFELTLQPFDNTKPPIKLTLHPALGENTVDIKIVNQVADALVNPNHNAAHAAAYRWFYNLSNPSVHAACNSHYYPKGPLGGNRCPQKLYWE